MSKTAQTDNDVRAANAADQFLLDAVAFYREHGIETRPEFQAVKNDVPKGQSIMRNLRALCDAHKYAIVRRMGNRGNKQGTSLTKAFSEVS